MNIQVSAGPAILFQIWRFHSTLCPILTELVPSESRNNNAEAFRFVLEKVHRAREFKKTRTLC